MMPETSDKGKPMARKDAVRHRTKVASHTAVPMGTANQRSLFAKRGKVNGWESDTTHINLADMQGTRANLVAYHKGRLNY